MGFNVLSSGSSWGDPTFMFQLSSQLISTATGQADALVAGAAALQPPTINPSFPVVSASPTLAVATEPVFLPVTWTTPAAPAAFSGSLDIITPDPFGGDAPNLVFAPPPGGFTGVVPPSPSIELNFTYPSVAVTLPTAPQLLSVGTVTFNPLAIPTFNVTVPTLVLTEPNIVSYVEKAWYASTTLTLVQSRLQTALTDDTDLGLTSATQQALWDAARDREYRQQAAAIADLERMETLGYAFPPGVFIDARVKIQTETNNTLAGLSREIMVEQAKLRLENVTKAREQAISLESKMVDYYNQINQRAFESAKYQTESAVSIYNAEVKTYETRLEAYKTQALVYDTQLKGITAYVEQLKAQIEFERTKAQIDQALVDAYRGEVDAAVAVLKVYETQVEIIKTQAEVEKIKVDAYGAQIQAFVGTVNAYSAEVGAYKTSIEAQGVIEQTYKTSVDAYAAEVAAGVSVVNAKIAGYRAEIDTYTAQLDGYKAALQAQVSQAQAATQYNLSEVEEYKGRVSAITSYNEVLTQQWKAVVDTNERIAEVAVRAAEANGQLTISTRNLQLEASKVGATVSAQLGSAALNAIHWSNSVSYGTSNSTVASQSSSTSQNTSTSTSQSSSTSENHNYDESV